MFNRVKKLSKGFGQNLGKILAGVGATAVIVGATAGAMATAKINNDVSTAITLSMGDKNIAEKLLEKATGYELSKDLTSLYSSALSFSVITPEKVTNELLQKASDNYFDKVKESSISFENQYGKKAPVDIISERLFEDRLSLINGDYFDSNMVGEAEKISFNELTDKFSDNYENYIKKSDPDFYANSFKKKFVDFDSISVPNLADLDMTEITKDANESLESLSFEKDPQLEKIMADYEAKFGEKVEPIDVEELLSEDSNNEAKKVRRAR